MTSKEALNQLYILADTPEQAMVIQSCYDIVERDLEVLEILKNKIDIYEWEQGGFIELKINYGTNIYKKIKEWLENKE